MSRGTGRGRPFPRLRSRRAEPALPSGRLFGGDDAKQVDDEGKQQYGDENEHHCAEVVGFAMVIFQGLWYARCP